MSLLFKEFCTLLNDTQLHDVCSELEASLRPEIIISRGKPYLDDLTPRKKQTTTLFEVVFKEAGSLAAFFRRPPIDSTDPEKGSRIDNQLSTLEVHKSHIEELWQNAWQLAEQGKQVQPVYFATVYFAHYLHTLGILHLRYLHTHCILFTHCLDTLKTLNTFITFTFRQKPRQTQQEPFKAPKRPEPIGKAPERKMTARRKESDKYGELEEAAYQVRS